MRIATTIDEVREQIAQWKPAGPTHGRVPAMGSQN